MSSEAPAVETSPGTTSLPGNVSTRSSASASSSPSSAGTIRKLRRLEFFTNYEFPDIAHDDELLNFVGFAYAANNTQVRFDGAGTKVNTDTFHEAMSLPEAGLMKTATEKEINGLRVQAHRGFGYKLGQQTWTVAKVNILSYNMMMSKPPV